jgi:hypothetical protein
MAMSFILAVPALQLWQRGCIGTCALYVLRISQNLGPASRADFTTVAALVAARASQSGVKL